MKRSLFIIIWTFYHGPVFVGRYFGRSNSSCNMQIFYPFLIFAVILGNCICTRNHALTSWRKLKLLKLIFSSKIVTSFNSAILFTTLLPANDTFLEKAAVNDRFSVQGIIERPPWGWKFLISAQVRLTIYNVSIKFNRFLENWIRICCLDISHSSWLQATFADFINFLPERDRERDRDRQRQRETERQRDRE